MEVKVHGEFKVEVGEKHEVAVKVGVEFKVKVGEKWEVGSGGESEWEI